MKYHITIWENKYVLPKVNLCHQKCGIDLLIMQKRKIIYYNLRKIIFSFSFCIKGKSMPPKLWSWNDRNFDQKRSKLFDMDRTFLLFAESKSMPPKLWHGFTRQFQWKIILQFASVNPCHQNCGPFAESKSMPPKLWHGFTQRFQWKIILKFEKIQKIHIGKYIFTFCRQ